MAKILLIDDDTVLLKLYQTRLEADQHQVYTATNGADGLRLLAQTQPDLIVLDLLMPKTNGFTFIDHLRQHPLYRHKPLLVFSSVANQGQIQRLQELGVNHFLNKTETTPTQLVTQINSLLQPPIN